MICPSVFAEILLTIPPQQLGTFALFTDYPQRSPKLFLCAELRMKWDSFPPFFFYLDKKVLVPEKSYGLNFLNMVHFQLMIELVGNLKDLVYDVLTIVSD